MSSVEIFRNIICFVSGGVIGILVMAIIAGGNR